MTEPQLNIHLKACPFCQNIDIGLYTRHALNRTADVVWYVQCDNCGARGSYDLGESGACEAWNTRPIEAQLLEACKKALEWSAQYPLGIASCEPDRDAARIVYLFCSAAIAAAEGAR